MTMLELVLLVLVLLVVAAGANSLTGWIRVKLYEHEHRAEHDDITGSP